ncbi:MAG: glycosyltransferase [Deltaproteobacteria bacterium]|nr:glycosyltransferase [Deltaproteobacteria bacterium]
MGSEIELVVELPPGSDPALAAALRTVSPELVVGSGDPRSARADAWHYAPGQPAVMLAPHHLRNVLLCLAHQPLDFVVVSHGLEEPPALQIVSAANAVVLSAAARRALRETAGLPPGAQGRILRLVPPPPGAALVSARLDDLGLGPLEADGPELRAKGTAWPTGSPPRRPACALFPSVPETRETVLVLPIMMAVGGVERNLIEVARALRDRYAFVVVTTERLSTARGSLSHQLLPWCEALFEIGELAPQQEFLALLETISASYRPGLVWICNGSPWLLAHSAELRGLFRDVPIVDQQVYDTDVGWIEHYGDAGIQSFDRFIAINRQIHRVFQQRFGIDPGRIDLVYHAVDTVRFQLAAADACPRREGARAYGLPDEGLRFGLVGRLTPQKRPLDFLQLARRARDAGLPGCFVLVGDGELAAECDAYAQRHELANLRRIPFCDDMSRLLPLFDGLVICSEYEGLPISMLEALAMGVPVLSTAVGDVPLVLEEYEVGRIVPRIGDPAALFEAFQAWRGELPALRERARRAAPRIAERFSAAAAGAAYDASWRRARAARG